MCSEIQTSTEQIASTHNDTQIMAHAENGHLFTYALYLHREELRKRFNSPMGISRTKLLLTQELISKTKKNISKCSASDLQILSRETIFKKNLRREIARQRHRQYLQMMRLKHQQKENAMRTTNTNHNDCQQHRHEELHQRHPTMYQQFEHTSSNRRSYID
ncbi:uncharacterized protein LOC142236367 [Haematobia irritans]|uniref:uncharacterized protein LOC142236367 n=1 Tax=Haematobia irritans TaxID=7368 RepID=UPI003F4FAAEA